MSSRGSLGRRLGALEAVSTHGIDLRAEAEMYGELAYRVPDGSRCYQRQDGEDFSLTIVGQGGTLTYTLVGVDGSQV